jgi:hypothetical protein
MAAAASTASCVSGLAQTPSATILKVLVERRVLNGTTSRTTNK